MVAHNYDGDMLTDEMAQIHRSPGFITSNLVGQSDTGSLIKEFEASHGTVTDLWLAHLRGQETSLNPLGLTEALLGAMKHAAELRPNPSSGDFLNFISLLRLAVHHCFRDGQGTRDLSGEKGLTTEQFVQTVARRLARYLSQGQASESPATPEVAVTDPRKPVDKAAIEAMFKEFDTDQNGTISLDEFTVMLVKLGIAPKKSA